MKEEDGMTTFEGTGCPALGNASACPSCKTSVDGAVEVYDRYYILKCNCGTIFMWPRKRSRAALRRQG